MAGLDKRIILVDALRGFALLGIVLIHFVEHFDFFYKPEVTFFVSPAMDQWVMDTTILLISGKAYSIFAITFGLSFFIQIHRKEVVGIDFRGRYIWRLCLLFIMGFLHSLIYRGDILHIYAVLGLPLVLLYKCRIKTLSILALLLIIEIPILYHLMRTFMDPTYTFVPDWGGSWFAEAEQVYASGKLWDVIQINAWKSRYLVYAWTYYTGRAVQLLALFILGLIIGKKDYFNRLIDYKKQISLALMISVLAVILLRILLLLVSESTLSDLQKGLFDTLFSAFLNLSVTLGIISLFIMIYLPVGRSKIFEWLAIYGRMSLTNYVSQAIFVEVVSSKQCTRRYG